MGPKILFRSELENTYFCSQVSLVSAQKLDSCNNSGNCFFSSPIIYTVNYNFYSERPIEFHEKRLLSWC